MKTRTEIINWLIRHNNYKKHLEIGVYKSHQNFDKIIVDYKVGVDPGAEGYSEATHTMGYPTRRPAPHKRLWRTRLPSSG